MCASLCRAGARSRVAEWPKCALCLAVAPLPQPPPAEPRFSRAGPNPPIAAGWVAGRAALVDTASENLTRPDSVTGAGADGWRGRSASGTVGGACQGGFMSTGASEAVTSRTEPGGGLMLVDTPSLYFRAFYGVPRSVTAPDGMPVNAVRGLLDV